MSYKIIPFYGHYELYINEELYCSADTYGEAIREFESYMKTHNEEEVK